MDNLYKLGKIEAIALLISIVLNLIIINVPSSIIAATGTSSWLNTIYISVIAIIFTIIICKLFKKFINQDLLDISEYLGGKILKVIVGIVFIVFFMTISTITLRYFSNSLKLIYFSSTPLIFIFLLFLIPPIILNKLGLKSIANTSLILCPFILISTIVLLGAAAKNFSVNDLFPILGYGFYETFGAGATNIYSFVIFGYLYFILPLLKNSNEFKTVSIVSVIISAIYLFLSVISLIMSFASITLTDHLISVYLLTRLINLGTFLQRLDAIFILLWILVTFSFLSISFFFILRVFKKITLISDSRELAYPLGMLIFSTSLIIKDIASIKFLSRSIFRYFSIFVIFIFSFIILLAANLKKKIKDGTKK